jgi:hypothetical protein
MKIGISTFKATIVGRILIKVYSKKEIEYVPASQKVRKRA